MATIIEFSARGLERRPSGLSAGAAAEIVIFPGIRYDRTQDEQTAQRRARRRDTLELED